ncbi:hypothetical protein SARC_10638 [Sphaeroforma arctica JP610]|uniref:Uncharacterized protein n=1 Tax=Sphaeroforma arctica JP610 TaxID=667725 RepID=A0A0L0FK80_9EUKA|nr:hypothetical protein SARC_10638 [Sphaeroforma arctica JP610]KNC76886.1 hypothetical protein SARC_10638 [Sphaeroforma arctica JP610]|eukprot:XP_014150788.1 hypothetical protein SARC_10638 [Sphaeroforma arctica JP610]
MSQDDSGVSEESEGEAADNKNGDELKGKATMSVETPSTADIDANAEDDADFPMDDDMGVEAAKDDKKPVKLDQK